MARHMMASGEALNVASWAAFSADCQRDVDHHRVAVLDDHDEIARRCAVPPGQEPVRRR
jgi:hypothetical protein